MKNTLIVLLIVLSSLSFGMDTSNISKSMEIKDTRVEAPLGAKIIAYSLLIAFVYACANGNVSKKTN